MNAAGATLQRAFSRNVRTAPALPPGPATPPLVQTLRLALQPFETFDACARRWGDWFTLRLLGGRMNVFCSHPDAVRDVHAGDPETFRGGEAAVDILQPLLGRNSLLVLDGERHLRERRLMSPPFHGERVHVYGRLGARQRPSASMAGWQPGRPFPIHHEMQTDHARRDRARGLRHRRRDRSSSSSGAGWNTSSRSPMGRRRPFIVLPFTQFELAGLTPWGQYVRRARAIDDYSSTPRWRGARRSGTPAAPTSSRSCSTPATRTASR